MDVAKGLFGKIHNATTHLLSPESREDLLTSSMPSALLHKELSKCRERNPRLRNQRLIVAKDEFMEDIDEDRSLQHRSLTYSASVSISKPPRQRSASLHGSQLMVLPLSPLKKARRTMIRSSRPPSTKQATKSRSGSGSLTADQQSADEETKARVELEAARVELEATFTTVKRGLMDLSAEDTVLQERMDKLSFETKALQRYVAGLKAAKKAAGIFGKHGNDSLLVSGKHTLTPTPSTEESWIETSSWKETGNVKDSCSEEQPPQQLQSFDGGDDSSSSCGGSLADSEGSYTCPCPVVVVDHSSDGNIPVSTPGYEDDVFLA